MKTVLLLAALVALAVATAATADFDFETMPRKMMTTREEAVRPWVLDTERPLAATEEVSFMLAVRQQNVAELLAKLAAVSDPTNADYGRYLTPAEVRALTMPTAAHRRVALAWAHSLGGGCQVRDMGDAVRVSGPAAAVAAALRTELHAFRHEPTGVRIVRHLGELTLPVAVAEAVDMVAGLWEFPYLRQRQHWPPGEVPASAQKVGVSYNIPETYEKLYNIPAGMSPVTQASQGVYSFEGYGGFLHHDLVVFGREMGISPPPNVTRVVGATESYAGTESSLDVQTIASVGYQADTTFFSETGWMFEFAQNLINEVHAGLPDVISVSYGWPEAGQCAVPGLSDYCTSTVADYMNRTNVEWAKLGVAGTTVVICSQDLGAPGEFNSDCQLDKTQYPMWPVYPGSSPYVVSVGSTALQASGNGIGLVAAGGNFSAPFCRKYNCSTGTVEVSAMIGNAVFTSGGGFSNYTDVNAAPAWQAQAVKKYLASGVPLPSKGYSAEGRGYPDLGSLGQNIPIVADGQIQITGGTSASTPLWAGIITLLNEHQLRKGKPVLGFAAPLLYQMAAAQPNTFNPVVKGGNFGTESARCEYGYYVAAKQGAGAWSPVTGLGSPNVANIVAWLDANT